MYATEVCEHSIISLHNDSPCQQLMMPHKGASTQCHNQQVLAKPHHTPSDRDQQAREKLQQKAKIESRAYIQLGEEALQIIHRTFQPDTPVILHLPALADGSLDSNLNSPPYCT